MKIIRAEQTCFACPSQWDSWDDEGHYWYLRFRFGVGTATREDHAYHLSFEYGDSMAGVIDLETFCENAGLELAL